MQSRGEGEGRRKERDEVECEVCKNTFLSDSQTLGRVQKVKCCLKLPLLHCLICAHMLPRGFSVPSQYNIL